jgi:hypothetical protein
MKLLLLIVFFVLLGMPTIYIKWLLEQLWTGFLIIFIVIYLSRILSSIMGLGPDLVSNLFKFAVLVINFLVTHKIYLLHLLVVLRLFLETIGGKIWQFLKAFFSINLSIELVGHLFLIFILISIYIQGLRFFVSL